MELEGKVAVVTGAASGIGRETARLLGAAGVRGVVIADIDTVAAEETAEQVREAGGIAQVCALDTADLESWRGLFAETEAHFGALHILNNNAAISEGEFDWPAVAPERAAAVVDVNLRGTVLGTQLALDPIQRSGGGCIVNTASGGAFAPSLPQAAYVATKAGIVHFTRSCADLLGTHGIRVSCVCPGMVDTPGFRALRAAGHPWLEAVIREGVVMQPETVSQQILVQMRDDASAGKVEMVVPAGVRSVFE